MGSQLFTRNYLNGLSDGLIDTGVISPWRNDKVAIEMFDKVASDLGLPEILEAALPDEINIKCGQYLVELNKFAGERGYGPSAACVAQAKIAAVSDVRARAMASAAYFMDKAAAEGSLTSTGMNTPESAAVDSSLASLDQKNRSSLQYLVGMGRTDMPEGGVIGRQMSVAPSGSPMIHNSLTSLDKQAAADAFTNAANFIQALVNEQHEPTIKTVLAAAGLASSGVEGLEVMAGLLNTKTAEELEEGLDAVVDTQDEAGAPPDPALVEAIEDALQEYMASKQASLAGMVGDDIQHMMELQGHGAPDKAEQALAYLKANQKGFGVGGESVPALAHIPAPAAAPKTIAQAAAAPKTIAQAAAAPEGNALLKRVREALARNKSNIGIAGGALALGGALGAGGAHLMNQREKEAAAMDKVKDAGKYVADKATSAGKYVKDKATSAGKYVKEHATTAGKAISDTAAKHPNAVKGLGAAALAGTAAAGTYAATRKKKDEKTAAFEEYLKRAAEGSLNDTGENTPESAKATSELAALDDKNRKPEEYLNGTGDTKLPNVGQVGALLDAPKAPEKVNPQTTPAKEAMYTQAIKVAVDKWAAHLPANMPHTEKQAHLIALAGMPEELQYGYVTDLRR